jgi:ubiquinone/menaquinone biosynthesis C-methylase UbiE
MCPKKKTKVAILNHNHLTNEYQQGMLSGLFLTPGIGAKPLNVLHLGTGAGIMPMFLKEQLGEKIGKITTIDNNA